MDDVIRLATADDAAAIAGIYGPYCEASAISFEAAGPTADEMAQRISAIGAEKPWLVFETARQVVGYAYAAPHHERAAYKWSVTTAIYIDRGYRERGIGRALYTTLLELLRELGYFRATAGVTLPNAASVGLHESLGFTPVGVYRHVGYKLGRWHDVAWFEAELQPPADAPPPPRPVSSLRGSKAWDRAVAKGLAYYAGRT